MTTAKVQAGKHKHSAFLDASAAVGEITGFRLTLRRIKLRDGVYRTLSKPVVVRVMWDAAVEYWVAVGSRMTFNGAGDSPDQALNEYLADWSEQLDWLVENEKALSKALLQDLVKLRRLLGLAHAA